MIVLLDTSVIIDLLRARQRRRELLAQLLRDGHKAVTSVVNLAEIYAGIRPAEIAAVEMFLARFECYPVTRAIARRAGMMKNEWQRRGRTLALPDTMIAAIAIEHDLILMTDNRRDFFMPEVQLYPLL